MPSRGSSSSCLVAAVALALASFAAAFSLSAGGDGNDRAEQLMASRRRCLTAIVAPAVLGWGITPPASQSAEGNERLLLGGVATLKDGTRFEPPEGLSPALYVTARPETMSNLQQYSVQGGKAPPVLAARFPISGEDAFPFRFQLTANDVTQEGAIGLESAESTKPYWWESETLVVSARLDSDGVAATRDPSDLVGRGVGKALSEDDTVVQLEGRGLFGKAVTNKK